MTITTRFKWLRTNKPVVDRWFAKIRDNRNGTIRAWTKDESLKIDLETGKEVIRKSDEELRNEVKDDMEHDEIRIIHIDPAKFLLDYKEMSNLSDKEPLGYLYKPKDIDYVSYRSDTL